MMRRVIILFSGLRMLWRAKRAARTGRCPYCILEHWITDMLARDYIGPKQAQLFRSWIPRYCDGRVDVDASLN